MRVWDIHPGYLNRESLLGEHREIHAIFSILTQNKKGYSRHPETLRWKKKLPALKARHDAVVAEMMLRGYRHQSPLKSGGKIRWPETFIDPPARQFQILTEKYRNRAWGRIPLPKNIQQLWAQHKYSTLARDPHCYRAIGREVSFRDGKFSFDNLSHKLVELLRTPVTSGRLENALLHMWGYVSSFKEPNAKKIIHGPSREILENIQRLALEKKVSYLLESTALSESVPHRRKK